MYSCRTVLVLYCAEIAHVLVAIRYLPDAYTHSMSMVPSPFEVSRVTPFDSTHLNRHLRDY